MTPDEQVIKDALTHFQNSVHEYLMDFIKKQGGVCIDDLTFVNVQHGNYLPLHLQGKEIQEFVLKANGAIVARTWLFWKKDIKDDV